MWSSIKPLHHKPHLAATFLLLLRSYSYFISVRNEHALSDTFTVFLPKGRQEKTNQIHAGTHWDLLQDHNMKSLKPTRSRVTCSSSQLQQVMQGSHLSPSGITGRQNCLFSSCGVAGDVRVSSATQDVFPSQCTQTRGRNRTSNPDLPCQTLK